LKKLFALLEPEKMAYDMTSVADRSGGSLQLTEAGAGKKPCKKGCCSGKKKTAEPSPPVEKKKPCTKGCCGGKKKPQPEKKACTKGCCGGKKPEKKACSKPCCASKKPVKKECTKGCCAAKSDTKLNVGGGKYLMEDEFPDDSSLNVSGWDSKDLVWWRKLAYFIFYLTVVWNAGEGAASIYFGLKAKSLALVAFGCGSYIEVLSACMAIYRLKREDYSKKKGKTLDVVALERVLAYVICTLLIVLAILAAVASTYRLAKHLHPETGVPGLVISSICIFVMSILYYWKVRAAKILESSTLEKEAYCSLGCIRENAVVFFGSIIFIFGFDVLKTDSFWWIDSVAAYVIAFLVMRYGIKGMLNACSPEFDGSCSCCASGSGGKNLADKSFIQTVFA